MQMRRNKPLVLILGHAIVFGSWFAASSGVMAQEQPKKPDAPPQEPAAKPEAATQPSQATIGKKVTVTGSIIARVRTDPALPDLVLDRAYIEQSGTTSTSELIRSLPQAQNFASPAPTPPARR